MNKTVGKFFILTFLFSWMLWLPTVVHSNWKDMPNSLLLLGMFSGFVPSVLGILFLRKEHGSRFKGVLKKKLSLDFSKSVFLWMLVFPLQAWVTLLIVKALDADFEIVNPISPAFTPLIFLQILFVGGALGEEFGWRGYAQEKFQSSFGSFIGTLVLGLIWSLWHLPLFFMSNTVQSHIPIYQFMLQNTLLAFFYTWFYQKTKGNLIVMILLHAVMNTSSAIFPYWQSNTGRFIGLGLLLLLILIMFTFTHQKKLYKTG